MIKILVPGYVVEDPTLAAVVDDQRHADRLCEALAGRKVGDCLSKTAPPPAIAAPDDTALEVAAQMAQARSPLVAVVDKDRSGRGCSESSPPRTCWSGCSPPRRADGGRHECRARAAP